MVRALQDRKRKHFIWINSLKKYCKYCGNLLSYSKLEFDTYVCKKCNVIIRSPNVI